MPAFNAGNHIVECIESIQAQTYLNWELCAVDDYSTDETRNILLNFAKKDDRITVYQNNKKGIIPALQLAFLQSSGELITRMDADDLMIDIKIETLVKTSLNHPASCITNYVKYFSDTALQGGFVRYADWLNEIVDTDSHWNSIYQECVIPSPSWMMHSKTLESVGGFDSDRYPEDYDLCFRLYEAKIPVIGIPKILHLWRDHPSRASRNDPHYADQHFYDLKLHYFINLDYDNTVPLFIWGGGPTGKKLARYLISRNIPFRWCTGNESKIGKHIYDVLMEPDRVLTSAESKQVLLAIKQSEFFINSPIFKSLDSSKCQVFRFH